MAAKTPMAAETPGTAETPTPSKHDDILDTFTGRKWPRQAVERLLVGRLYGSCDWDLTSIHLGLAYENFADLTIPELQRFWNDILPRTGYPHVYSTRTREHPRVKMVLEDIKALLDDALEFFEANHEEFKTL